MLAYTVIDHKGQIAHISSLYFFFSYCRQFFSQPLGADINTESYYYQIFSLSLSRSSFPCFFLQPKSGQMKKCCCWTWTHVKLSVRVSVWFHRTMLVICWSFYVDQQVRRSVWNLAERGNTCCSIRKLYRGGRDETKCFVFSEESH